MRVPGLLVWPEVVLDSKVITTPCSTSDFFPTILDILDISLEETESRPYDGISLLPLIMGEVTDRPIPIAFESKSQVALTDNRYKIYSGDGGSTYELYDLIEDPTESRNLANQRPDLIAKMAEVLAEWRASCERSNLGLDYLQSALSTQNIVVRK